MPSYAGRCVVDIVDTTGNALPQATVTVRRSGSAATLYTTRAKTTTLANPVPSGVPVGTPGLDTAGNLLFYAEPGDGYDLVVVVGAVTVASIPIVVAPDAAELPRLPGDVSLSVTDISATGGNTDQAAAVNAQIAAMTPNNPATSVNRVPSGRLWIPKGRLRCDYTVELVRGVYGAHVHGAGRHLSVLKAYPHPDRYPSGVMPRAVDVNGATQCELGGFTVEVDGTNGEVTEAIAVRWDDNDGSPTDSALATTATTLRDISVKNQSAPVKWVAGLRLGMDGESNQVDSINCYDLHVHGGYSPDSNPDPTFCQRGWDVGHSLTGNNYLHCAFGCQSAGVKYGVYLRGSSINWFGGEIQSCEACVYYASPYFFAHFVGFRPEHARRLISSVAGTTSNGAVSTYDTITYNGSSIATDGEIIQYHFPGVLNLRSLRIVNTGAVVPKFRFEPAAPLTVVIDGLLTPTPIDDMFIANANVVIEHRGVLIINPNTGSVLSRVPAGTLTGPLS